VRWRGSERNPGEHPQSSSKKKSDSKIIPTSDPKSQSAKEKSLVALHLFLAQMGTCCLLSENDASKRVCVLFVAVKITKLAIAQITKTTPRHKAVPLPLRTTPMSQRHLTQPRLRRPCQKLRGSPSRHVRGVLHPARARAYCLGRGSQTQCDTLFKFIVYPLSSNLSQRLSIPD